MQYSGNCRAGRSSSFCTMDGKAGGGSSGYGERGKKEVRKCSGGFQRSQHLLTVQAAVTSETSGTCSYTATLARPFSNAFSCMPGTFNPSTLNTVMSVMPINPRTVFRYGTA